MDRTSCSWCAARCATQNRGLTAATSHQQHSYSTCHGQSLMRAVQERVKLTTSFWTSMHVITDDFGLCRRAAESRSGKAAYVSACHRAPPNQGTFFSFLLCLAVFRSVLGQRIPERVSTTASCCRRPSLRGRPTEQFPDMCRHAAARCHWPCEWGNVILCLSARRSFTAARWGELTFTLRRTGQTAPAP